MNFKIRRATANDMIHVYELMKELDGMEDTPSSPKIDVKKLIEDGFESPTPAFKCLVAEDLSSSNDQKIVGYGLYCYSYSSWAGRIIFLEDLFVKPEYRRHHIGMELMKTIAQEAVNENCGRLECHVLSCNSAMKFYEKLNGVNITRTEKWNYVRFQSDSLVKIINS